jgi:ligand-binding SRPBCC domain-containing protein
VIDFVFESRVWVAGARPEVFALLTEPANLPLLTPAWLGLVLLSPPPVPMTAGAVVDIRARWFLVRGRVRIFAREYDPPVRLLEVQLRGPYARWEHRRIFLEDAGGTRVDDRLVYRLPLGVFGRLAGQTFARRRIEAVFRHRNAVLAARFGVARAAPPP